MTIGELARGHRLRDGASPEKRIHVVQGEFAVSDEPDTVLVTILGSCVAACLWDRYVNVGGMNHFLLPGDMTSQSSGEARRHTVHAMELLVNALLVKGASRSSLEAKVFGGASTMRGVADVGRMNGEFALDFLRRENIAVAGECLGGSSGRRVQYWPSSGRARRSFMDYQQVPQAAPQTRPSISPDAGRLELF